MIAGVFINGRQYSQGSVVEYLPKVRPRGNVEGVGGRAGSSESCLIGTINMFYVFHMKDNTTDIFVDITNHPIKHEVRSIYVLGLTPHSLEPGFTRTAAPGQCFIHIDSITHKVLLAPHYDPDLGDTYTNAIRMWEAK